MSTLRNAVHRRNHKERAQPVERAKWGLLEKRKDYRLRAADFKAKKAKKTILSRLAAARNPDEFHFGMTSSRTRDGGIRVAARPDSVAIPQDQAALLKTQDAGYLRLQSGTERAGIAALEEKLAFVGAAEGKHVVFVDGEEEAKAFRPEEFFDTHPDLVERRFNRPKMEQLEEGGFGEKEEGGEGTGRREEKRENAKIARRRVQAYKELEARMKREEDIRKLEREQELQRARMGKGGSAVKGKFNTVRKR